jgi:hypothetical protein
VVADQFAGVHFGAVKTMTRRQFVNASLAVAFGSAAFNPFADAAFDPTSDYERRSLQGFTVFLNRAALQHEQAATDALKLLEEKLAGVVKSLQPDRLEPLRKVAFWVEWEARGSSACMYHPSVEWLRAHDYNPQKAKSVEINNLRHFLDWRDDQPMMVLHELAHAYHHLVLTHGHRGVKAAYENARKTGIYDSVGYVRGGKRRAYA